MGKKLYVGNLSYDTTTPGLEAYFATVGEVEDAVVLTDRETGRSRGFGFVTMATDEAASTAVQQLNGTSLDGRTIKVDEARERRPRENRGGGGYNRW